MRLVVLAIALSAACAKIDPEPTFETASFRVTQAEDSAITVEGALYTIRFAGGGETAMHFPDVLTIAGSSSPNVLGDADAAASECTDEQLVGMAMFPAFVTAPAISMESVLGLPASTENEDLNSIGINTTGPHIVQISTRYTVDYSCGSEERFEGRSTFTMFPNGRITRHDQDLRPSTNMLTAGGQACGCDAADSVFAFTSFWTFEKPAGVFQRNNDRVTFNPGSRNSDQQDLDGVCLSYPQHTIGVSYGGSGISRVRDNTNNTGAVFDFNLDVTLEPTDIGPNGEQPFDSTSSMQIVADDNVTDCGGSVLELLSEPGVEVGGLLVPATDFDGIYNDFVQHDKAFEIRSTGVGDLPPGFTLRTVISSGSAKITRSPDLGTPPALVQRDGEGNQFLFYFPDGLASGETITIAPQ